MGYRTRATFMVAALSLVGPAAASVLAIPALAAPSTARVADRVPDPRAGGMAAALARNGQVIEYQKIPDFAARALEQKTAIVELVQRYVFMENCVVVGRGLAYANAYEFALKLMETCYVVAERFSAADFLHGPVAMIERHFPVILFAPPGAMLQDTKDLLSRLQELSADTLAITADLDAAAMCSRAIIMPREIDEFLAPFPYIIPAQLFAALLAEAKGLNPDRPRSLSKVTRTL